MTEQTDQDDVNKYHRRFAAECNNAAWDLIDKDDRTADEDRDMVAAAYAASFHWSKVGGPVEIARSDVTLAHALSLVGNITDGLACARRALSFFESGQGEDWDLAFAHMEMALAAAVASDETLHDLHYQKASELGQAIASESDRVVFQSEFERIPNRVLPG